MAPLACLRERGWGEGRFGLHHSCSQSGTMRARPGAARPRKDRMPGHTLLVHPDVEDWMHAQPDLRRRVDWLLFELSTRGDAGRPKGIVGPAAQATDAPAVRWRRSGVGGFHYYAWWFSAADWDGIADPRTIAVRAVRHHDEMRPLAAG